MSSLPTSLRTPRKRFANKSAVTVPELLLPHHPAFVPKIAFIQEKTRRRLSQHTRRTAFQMDQTYFLSKGHILMTTARQGWGGQRNANVAYGERDGVWLIITSFLKNRYRDVALWLETNVPLPLRDEDENIWEKAGTAPFGGDFKEIIVLKFMQQRPPTSPLLSSSLRRLREALKILRLVSLHRCGLWPLVDLISDSRGRSSAAKVYAQESFTQVYPQR